MPTPTTRVAYRRPGTDLETQMRHTLLLALVQRAIFCPVTDEVLDVDTCVVFLDRDGDPSAVCSQTGYRALLNQDPGKLDVLAAGGHTVDPDSLIGADL